MSISVTQQTPDFQPVNIKITYQTEVAILAKLFYLASTFTQEEMSDLVELENVQHYEDLQSMFVRLKNSLNNYVTDPM